MKSAAAENRTLDAVPCLAGMMLLLMSTSTPTLSNAAGQDHPKAENFHPVCAKNALEISSQSKGRGNDENNRARRA
jgi:hypothetical protein